jgi:hypothetical protein
VSSPAGGKSTVGMIDEKDGEKKKGAAGLAVRLRHFLSTEF